MSRKISGCFVTLITFISFDALIEELLYEERDVEQGGRRSLVTQRLIVW